MGVNILGWRKRSKIIDATGLPVLHAWVVSHHNSGRTAYLTIGWDAHHRYHRHAVYDRRDGTLAFVQNGPHGASCDRLFPREMQRYDREAESALRDLLATLGDE